MIVIEDVGNKVGQHTVKNDYFKSSEISVIRQPLPVGDYVLMNDKIQDVIDRKNSRNIDIKKMDFMGCYNVAVDSKRDIQELVQNITGKKEEHDRFRDELILAQNNGIKLIILVENKGGEIGKSGVYNKTVLSIDDLFSWKNPRLFLMKPTNEIIGYWKNGEPKYKMTQRYPKATHGATIAKACITMEQKYGVRFLFCKPEDSAEIIIKILKGEM
ncbi:MAG: ERCC4 domain-containing protein [Lachnospiraceae bacterium]|nr:ERCC4 domain-containing protein [Lachnospiraceae bacterium]